MAKTQRILVIDDDPDVGMLIQEAAKANGNDCIVTTDADSFFKAFTPEVTLIFLDLMIPGLDGVEILRQLGRKRCVAGVVLMSGIGKRVMESANSLAMSLGLYMVGHLAKPFRIADLEKLIGGYVDPEPQSSVGQGAEIYFEGADLWRAVERNEFVLHYQPQIEIKTGRVVGVEGLVRWQHPGQGIVLPGRFIESVEDLGLIDQLTLLVFHHGLSELDLFGRSDEGPLTLSLNISALSLQNLDFPNRFVGLVEAYGHEPSNMILEINESGLIRQLSRTLDVLTRLRMKHVQLSIDDFGIGYSMMDQLRNVPATEIKIDKSIVQNMHNDNSRVIIQKTIELGHDLGMRVTAEGVETQDQLNFLRAQHCDIVQGYLFSEPLSSARLLEWMAQYRPSRISSGH